MRPFHLLLAIAMLLHLTVSATEIHSCCPQADCTMVECINLGCATTQTPAALDTITPQAAAHEAITETAFLSFTIPKPIKEIWTPPD